MLAYRFYPRADATQDKIWRDTIEKRDEEQAVTYITGLPSHLRRSCEERAIWPRCRQTSSHENDREKSAEVDFLPVRRKEQLYRATALGLGAS